MFDFCYDFSWDLTYLSLRRVIRSPVGILNQLIKVVGQIINGTIPCGGLKHFVWLTAVPHPPCYTDSICLEKRGFRNNYNFAAYNEILIHQLLLLPTVSHIKFTIIDSYNIVNQRLIFNEQFEAICGQHFLCRVLESNGNISVVITPGGDAVVETLLIALSQ